MSEANSLTIYFLVASITFDPLYFQELRKIHPNLSEEEIAQLAAAKISEEQTHNHLWYRINATRKIGGGHKLTPQMNEELSNVCIY